MSATEQGPDEYVGIEKKSQKEFEHAFNVRGSTECTRCHGYGEWFTMSEDTGRIFGRSHCSRCNGWGYLKPGFKGYDIQYEELKAEWQDKIHREPLENGRGYKTGIYICDPELEPPDLALLYAADGWWKWNFGGIVKKLGPGRYRVTVYTD